VAGVTRIDIAKRLGVSEQVIKDAYCGRKHGNIGVQALAEELGYVTNEIAGAQTTKSLKVIAVLGCVTNWISALQKHSSHNLLVSADFERGPTYIYKKYYCFRYIAFNTNINFDEAVLLEQPIILVECPRQTVFSAVNGFSPDISVQLALNMLNCSHQLWAMQIRRLD